MVTRPCAPTPPELRYLLKLPWAALLRLHAWVAHGSCRAGPVHVYPVGTGPSAGATEVGLPIGPVAWEPSQWYHSVLAGGGQKGTSRKTQVCRMFWKNRRIELCLGQGGLGQLEKVPREPQKTPEDLRSNEVGRELTLRQGREYSLSRKILPVTHFFLTSRRFFCSRERRHRIRIWENEVASEQKEQYLMKQVDQMCCHLKQKLVDKSD